MIERDVINDEITSGDAGCICTRLDECVDGPCIDFRLACCLVREGGGVVNWSMATWDF